MRKQYYIDSPFWRKINTRTEALGEFLSGFKHTLVEFNDERTPHITKEDLLAFIELHVSNINERIGRGRKLTVRMGEFVGDIIYSFEFEGKSDVVGNIRLKPKARRTATDTFGLPLCAPQVLKDNLQCCPRRVRHALRRQQRTGLRRSQ